MSNPPTGWSTCHITKRYASGAAPGRTGRLFLASLTTAVAALGPHWKRSEG
jgi:hypothetical protein